MYGWLLLIAIPVFLLLVLVALYNRAQTLMNRCDESWSNVDTELRRRHELIPNLVNTVKGYAAHETKVLQEVTRARTAARKVEGAADATRAEQRVSKAMDRLLAVAEAYPDLKASSNFLNLQEELVITEDRIQAARRFYNANVRDLRNHLRQFPGNVVQGMWKWDERVYFEAGPAERVAPAVHG